MNLKNNFSVDDAKKTLRDALMQYFEVLEEEKKQKITNMKVDKFIELVNKEDNTN